jgi:hypothetical protein
MTNEALKETVEKVYADYALADRAILSDWTGKETDITVMRIRDYNFRWYSRKEYLRYCAKNGKSMRYFHKGCSK